MRKQATEVSLPVLASYGGITMSAEPGRKKGYSDDLRWRMVYQRIGMNLDYKIIASHLNVATSTVHRNS